MHRQKLTQERRLEQLVNGTKQKKESQMPSGKGTYGTTVGRPPKKPKGGKKK